MMKIGFLGFGEAAQAFVASLRANGDDLHFAAWDILQTDSALDPVKRSEMADRAVEILSGPDRFVDCTFVISAVTAGQSLSAIRLIENHIRPGQTLIDINSVAPPVKAQSACLIQARGAAYPDMAVMAPVNPRGHRTPVLVAGPVAQAVWPQLRALGFSGEIVGGEVGAAASIKMVRSLFVKGLEALTVETLLAAAAAGCLETVLESLSASYPGLGWPDIAAYHFDRVTQHGQRRAEEMLMSAETLDFLGLHGDLAREIASVHANTHGLGNASKTLPLATLVAEVLQARIAKAPIDISVRAGDLASISNR